MMDFLHYILPVIIYAVLLAIHYFLSRTGNKILGLIVPAGVIASLVYMYQADIIHMKMIGVIIIGIVALLFLADCLLYTSPSPRDKARSRMPSSA